jgi:hypothetical protein
MFLPDARPWAACRARTGWQTIAMKKKMSKKA